MTATGAGGTGRSRGRRTALAGAVLLAACLAVPPLEAQETDPAGLDAVAAAADSGAADRARRLLEAWRADQASSADLSQLQRSSFLAARLTADADSARELYGRLAVEAEGELGARARIRLAQLQLAAGKLGPALRQLELVRADLPGHPLAAESWLWSGRARLASGDTAGACDALRRAAGSGEGLAERAARTTRGCGLGPPSDSVRIVADEAGQDPVEGGGWTVQLGAFSQRSAADRLLDRLREAGWSGRRAAPGSEDGLHRVRVGRWDDREEAEQAARALEEAGFGTIVVRAPSNGTGP